MSANYMQAHSMSKGCTYADYVDLFYERGGSPRLLETMHIDLLSDLGMDDESIAIIHRGGRVEVELRAVSTQPEEEQLRNL